MHNIYQRLNRLMYVILPYSKNEIALVSLLIFPAYLILRWILTGRFTIKPA